MSISGALATSEGEARALRWEAALKRANVAGVKVYRVSPGQFVVTSATDGRIAYLTDGEVCSCPAAMSGDPVCLHRAAVRAHLSPDPDPPEHSAYDPDAEALRWAYNDRDRAHRDIDRYNAKIAKYGSLNERDYRGFLDAQQREQDASLRIAELTSTMNARAAA